MGVELNELVEALRHYFDNVPLVLQAADAIEELQKDLERTKDFEAFWQKEAEDALRKFQVAIAANKPKWIPVTERLPEPNTRVIGFMAWKGITAIEYQHGNWYSIDHLQPLPDEAVTHWMPLPEPPKTEEGE